MSDCIIIFVHIILIVIMLLFCYVVQSAVDCFVFIEYVCAMYTVKLTVARLQCCDLVCASFSVTFYLCSLSLLCMFVVMLA